MVERKGTTFARALRATQTRAESSLWAALRNRRLDGFKFRRQFPIDRYVADFACIDAKVVVELDGPSHGPREAYDAERTAAIEACGFVVIRFSNEEVAGNLDGVVETIRRALRLEA